MAKSKADAVMKRRKSRVEIRNDPVDQLVERMREKQAVREKELTALTEADIRKAERMERAAYVRSAQEARERKDNKVVGQSVVKAMSDWQQKINEEMARELERAMGHAQSSGAWIETSSPVEISTRDPARWNVSGEPTTWVYPTPVPQPAPPPVIGIDPKWFQEAYERAAQSDCMVTLAIGHLGIEVMAQDGDGYVVETATWKDMKSDNNPLPDLIVKVERAITTRGVLASMVASGNE